MADRVEDAKRMFEKADIPLTNEDETFLRDSYSNVVPAVEAASALYSSKLIKKSLEEHAAALVKSAEASEKYSAALVKSAEASERHAANLARATWVLAFATILLFVATALLALVTYLAYHSTIIR